MVFHDSSARFEWVARARAGPMRGLPAPGEPIRTDPDASSMLRLLDPLAAQRTTSPHSASTGEAASKMVSGGDSEWVRTPFRGPGSN